MMKFKSCVPARNIDTYRQNFTFLSTESSYLANTCTNNSHSVHEAMLFLINVDNDDEDETKESPCVSSQDMKICKHASVSCDGTHNGGEITSYFYAQDKNFLPKPLENILHFILLPQPKDRWFDILNTISTIELNSTFLLPEQCIAKPMYVKRFLDKLHDKHLPKDSALATSKCDRNISTVVMHAFRMYDPEPAAELQVIVSRYDDSFSNPVVSNKDCVVFRASTRSIIGRLEDTISPPHISTYAQQRKRKARTKLHKCIKYKYGHHLHKSFIADFTLAPKRVPRIHGTQHANEYKVFSVLTALLYILFSYIFIFMPASYVYTVFQTWRKTRKIRRSLYTRIHIDDEDNNKTEIIETTHKKTKRKRKTNLRSVKASPYFPA